MKTINLLEDKKFRLTLGIRMDFNLFIGFSRVIEIFKFYLETRLDFFENLIKLFKP